MKDAPYPVAYNHCLTGDYFQIGLETGWSDFTPGQFGMLEVPRDEGLLLRRPFSFARQQGKITEILYKVVGKGTRVLQTVLPGQSLRLLGPLGHGFSLSSPRTPSIGVAGGYGIAPFLELAKKLQEKGDVLTLFYGARTKGDLLYISEFKRLYVKLYLSTEDGSEGHHGRITELLPKVFPQDFSGMLWSCGPMGLLKAVAEWALSKNAPCEVSVEETMGCGTGVCLGCVIQDIHGHYVRACVEGPVFDCKAIKL